MKVLLAYNLHRHGGGSDAAAKATGDLLRGAGVEVFEFVRDSRDLPRGLPGQWHAFRSGLYAREGIRDFRAALASFRPDLVHAQELYPLISPWILPLSRKAGVPVVMTCHDYRLTCPVATHVRHGAHCIRCAEGSALWCAVHNCRGRRAESLAYGLRGWVARRGALFDAVDHFITATAFARDWLVEHAGLDRRQVTVIPYPIDLPDAVSDPGSGDYVAYAGRFAPEKGVDLLVEATRRLGIPLHLAGDPGAQSFPGHVTCRGMLQGAAMSEFYGKARMLVVPSTWFETFGIVAGEAMAHGIPVVASRIGALAEVVEDGVRGVSFTPGDVEELARCIDSLWNDPIRSRQLGARGRAYIEAQCAPGVHQQNLLAVYHRLLHPDGKEPV